MADRDGVAVAAEPMNSTGRATAKALRITVLAGGVGPEREVSLQSGQAVAEALRRIGHHVLLRDIQPTELSALDQPADFIFIALHGEFGEDGQVQAELERRGIAFCGSDAVSSALAMDKVAAKRRFEAAGVPTPAWELVTHAGVNRWVPQLSPPVVVKPPASGSSVDTTIARTPVVMRDAVQHVARRYGGALIERYVQGVELTVGVLGEEALPPCQIRTQREFYDYQAKYIDDDTEYLFEIDLPAHVLTQVQQLSRAAHQALGCAVFSRVDWMVDAHSLQPYALEVNTIPGFTSHSLLPKAAQRVGISFDELCQRIVKLSLKRHSSDPR